jgi:hypothetical protein
MDNGLPSTTESVSFPWLRQAILVVGFADMAPGFLPTGIVVVTWFVLPSITDTVSP